MHLTLCDAHGSSSYCTAGCVSRPLWWCRPLVGTEWPPQRCLAWAAQGPQQRLSHPRRCTQWARHSCGTRVALDLKLTLLHAYPAPIFLAMPIVVMLVLATPHTCNPRRDLWHVEALRTLLRSAAKDTQDEHADDAEPEAFASHQRS